MKQKLGSTKKGAAFSGKSNKKKLQSNKSVARDDGFGSTSKVVPSTVASIVDRMKKRKSFATTSKQALLVRKVLFLFIYHIYRSTDTRG